MTVKSRIPHLALILFFKVSIVQGQLVTKEFNVKIGGQIQPRKALNCIPEGAGPWPILVFNHGSIVDMMGWPEAKTRGYRLDEICNAFATEGYFVFAPIRERSARGRGYSSFETYYPEVVSQAIDYVKTLKNIDPLHIVLAGFSMGGLTSFKVSLSRNDLRVVILLAPAFGRGILAEFAQDVSRVNAPTLVMVEESDEKPIKKGVEVLRQAFQTNNKLLKIVRLKRGGGHELFYKINYWFEDLKSFLKEHS